MIQICRKCSCYYQPDENPAANACFAGRVHEPCATEPVNVPRPGLFATSEGERYSGFNPCQKCGTLCIQPYSNHNNRCPDYDKHELLSNVNFQVMIANGETDSRVCRNCGSLYNNACGDKRCALGTYHLSGESYVIEVERQEPIKPEDGAPGAERR